MNHAILHVRQFNVSGNATAIIFPDQSLAVFDWGELDEQAFPSLLDQYEIERVRFVMATHSHTDHTIGLPGVLRTIVARDIKIDAFVYPAIRLDNRSSNYLARSAFYARENNIKVVSVDIADFQTYTPARPIPITDCPSKWEVAVLAPPASINNAEQLQSHLAVRNPGNQTSIVSLFRPLSGSGQPQQPQGRALLPGDATKAVLKFAAGHEEHFPEYSLYNDVMIAPHHGSKHNWPTWLKPYTAGLVVVSCGHSEEKLPAHDFLVELSKHCKIDEAGSNLLCTSYSAQCRSTFGARATNQRLVGKGPCFGTIEVELDPRGSKLIGYDSDGPNRRPFGFCGQ